jgi:hypothetical protein
VVVPQLQLIVTADSTATGGASAAFMKFVQAATHFPEVAWSPKTTGTSAPLIVQAVPSPGGSVRISSSLPVLSHPESAKQHTRKPYEYFMN